MMYSFAVSVVRYYKLSKLVRRFFEILDTKEESFSSGTEFHPTRVEIDQYGVVYIPTCRVMRMVELNKLFEDMKELSDYDKYTNTRHKRAGEEQTDGVVP